MQGDLLFTKFLTPPQRPNLIGRDRLNQMLDTALLRHHHLALVSARAGSGKTTLVSEWLHARDLPSVWIALDERDDAPLQFFSYVSEALSHLGINIERDIINALSLDPLPDPAALVAELANAINRHEEKLVFVLDDFHYIRNEWISHALEQIIATLPPQALLIVISRQDPPFHLSKLRARDQLTEIRSQDLRFSNQEAALFFRKTMGVPLDEADLSSLEDRTEGWIAGLQLAAITLKGSPPVEDREDIIRGLTKTNRFIIDYLTEEVLRLQPKPVQDFLLETSILGIMNGSLCEAVHLFPAGEGEDPEHLSSPPDALPGQDPPLEKTGKGYLEYLEQNNLFIIPLDENREWYRYHHLFADLLQITLQQSRSAAEIRELHSRAAKWHRIQGATEEALAHAIAAGEYDFAASLINEDFAGLFSRNEVPVFLGWIDKLPEEIIQKSPWIMLSQAYTYVLSGKPAQAEPLLAEVESRNTGSEEDGNQVGGHIAAIRAFCANLAQDGDTALDQAASVLRDLSPSNSLARGLAAYTLADTHIAKDDLVAAEVALNTLLQAGEQSNHLLLSVNALCELAEIQTANGNLKLAENLLGQVKEKLDRLGLVVSREICAYDFAMAVLLCEKNQLDQALIHAEEGMEYRSKLGGYLVLGDLALMRVLQARGDVSGALEALSNAESYFSSYQYQMALSCRFQAERMTQWILAGDPAMAQQVSRESGESELEVIAKAKLALTLGDVEQALAALVPQVEKAQQGGRYGRVIEILLLNALALDISGNPSEALSNLQEAITLAKPQGYKRVFLDLGSSLLKLLNRYLEKTLPGSPSSLSSEVSEAFSFELGLLDEFSDSRSPGLQVPAPDSLRQQVKPILTERELEVLTLLALGITNKQMAERLVVAPSTVKQHLKNIYDKLDVNSRTQAVVQARDLGLL